jgi:exopolysaccharide production protein ExoQ
MPASLAILLCALGVAFLFRLNRDGSARNSKALWIPVIWLCLVGSRPIPEWFEGPKTAPTSDLQGSPIDAAAYGLLVMASIIVLATRGKKVGPYLPVMAPVIAYSIYCLISVSWSPVPAASLKRWIKDVGDVSMALVLVTETQPVLALRRLFARVGFLLFPLSVDLIRYTSLGRAWNNDGELFIVGVTTNKNMFGLILFVISLGTLWNFRWLLMNKGEPNRNQRLAAQGLLLACGLYLLQLSHSSTSLACLLLGSGLMLATHLRVIRIRPSRIYVLGLAVFVGGGLALALGGAGGVASALGRDSSFSGRTDIWAALFPTVSNPLIGTGFDSYWNSPNVLIFQRTLNSQGWYHAEYLNEAHDGYLEVYLNLGWIGVCLLATILITGYIRACKSFARNRELGGLLLAYICTGMIYSITEAGFRTLSACWIFILLSFTCSSGIVAGLFPQESGHDHMRPKKTPILPFA